MNEIKQNIEKLLGNEDLRTMKIATESGVDYSIIHKLRSGKKNIDNVALATALRLENYYKEVEKMEEIKNKVIENIESGEVIFVDGLGQYFTDIDGDYDYNVEHVALNEVEYKGKDLYEVEISRTEEIPFNEKLEKENINDFYNMWLEKDQNEETYIESIYFEDVKDAKDYIRLVLKGVESLEECAEKIGYFE